ncbi:DUF4406 domain-containing protein [Veillonella sp.]|uniref:DUF4406 domain-containing protein n=1 Tax=Veillonella sp. TaxID=1926307 RepID=UPI0025D0C477|nr:DUF4406 domain-containing protein [Veillonella sp.]
MNKEKERTNLIYVAHPYGGLEENRLKIDHIMKWLVLEDESNVYLSPIHNFGFMYLTGDEYQKGLNICLRMLEQCDVLVLCGDWRASKGCKQEFDKAKEMGIPIYTFTEWKEHVNPKAALNNKIKRFVEELIKRGDSFYE